MADLETSVVEDVSTGETETSASEVDYKSQYEEMMIQNAKLKKAMDKAMSEAAENKRMLRERQSAEEIAAQEKAEREAERAEVDAEKDRKLAMYENRDLFRNHFNGLDSETIDKLVDAELNGEKEIVYSTIAKYYETVIEQKLNEQKNDLFASRPPVSTGSNGADGTLTKAQIMAIKDATERQRLIAEHSNLFI